MTSGIETRKRIDLRTIVTALNSPTETVYVTDGDELYEIDGVQSHGVFALANCRQPIKNRSTIGVAAVELALNFVVVTPTATPII